MYYKLEIESINNIVEFEIQITMNVFKGIQYIFEEGIWYIKNREIINEINNKNYITKDEFMKKIEYYENKYDLKNYKKIDALDFRVKDIIINKTYYDNNVLINKDKEIYLMNNNDTIEKLTPKEWYQLEFSTGLEDKVGSKIYENDVLEDSSGERYIVEIKNKNVLIKTFVNNKLIEIKDIKKFIKISQ